MSELAKDYRNLHVPDDQSILDHLAPRKNVHYIPHIHVVITYFHVLSFILLTTLGVIFTNMGDSNFFKFTDPVVSGQVINERWKVIVVCVIIGIDSLFARIASEVIGEWKSLFVRDEKHRNRGKAIGLVAFDLMMHWVRTALQTVFLYSQISFAIAFALGDMLAHYVVTKTKVSNYLDREKNTSAAENPYNFYRRHWSESAMWMLVAAEVIGFGLLQYSFWVSDFFSSDYFKIGPPISFFAVGMNNDLVYWIVFVHAFFDQITASYSTAIISPWIFSYVYNNSNHDTSYSKNEVYTVFYTQKIVNWLRSIVVLNLVMEQVTFTMVFFLAELIYSVTHTWISYDRRGANPQGIWHAVVLRWIQGIGVIVFALSMQVWKPLKIVDAEGTKTEFGYFVLPPPFFLLGELITVRSVFWLFALYAFFDRAIRTLASEIITPYIAFVIDGGDHHDVYYGRLMTKIIVWMDNISNWVRTVFSVHFMLSSFYFSLTMMISDVVTSAFVLDAYMEYKKKAQNQIDLYHQMFGFNTDPELVLSKIDNSDRYGRSKPRLFQQQVQPGRGGSKYE